MFYHFPDHCRCKEFSNNICSGAKSLSASLLCLFSWRELPSFSAAQQSQGKNSQAGHFSLFYFIPFWNMHLDEWQANLTLFDCVSERYVNVFSRRPSPESVQPASVPHQSNLSGEPFISSWFYGVQRPLSLSAFANTLLFGFPILSQIKKHKEAWNGKNIYVCVYTVNWVTQDILLVLVVIGCLNSFSQIHLISVGFHMDKSVYCRVDGNLFSTWISKYFPALK